MTRAKSHRKARPKVADTKRRARRRSAAPYHHGDLRRALLDATEELLESEGLESFTLREVARRAGVSHGAPAHHFGDVRGLLSEFTAESFAEMTALMQAYRAKAGPGAGEQLAAVGRAYVDYALQNRARFQLMFRSDRLDQNHPALAAAGAAAYAQLVDCITRIAEEIDAPGYAIKEKIALAWSMVHGYATLLIDNEKFAEQMAQGHGTRAMSVFNTMLELSRSAFVATPQAQATS